MQRGSANVESLLRRLSALARHPSAFKRLGSALAFSNFYTVFRYNSPLLTSPF